MKIIGLTGGSGAGKGECARIFGQRGIPCLDTDKVARKLLVPGEACLLELQAAFRERFGMELTDAHGGYDRRAMAQAITASPEKRALLNSITHRHILACCERWIAGQRAAGFDLCVIDAPLLYESGFDARCDAVVYVSAAPQLRIARIMARDGIGEQAAQARLAMQMTDAQYAGRADYIIDNNGSADALEAQIGRIIARIL